MFCRARKKERYSLFSSICLSLRSGICRERMCPLTTSAHLSSDSMMFHGCERSTTIITVVCSIVSWVRTNGSNWLCQTTPSRIHTPMRSMKSAEGWGEGKGRRAKGGGKRIKYYTYIYMHAHMDTCTHAYTHTRRHAHTHTCTHTDNTHTHTTHIHIHTHTHTHTITCLTSMCNDSVWVMRRRDYHVCSAEEVGNRSERIYHTN